MPKIICSGCGDTIEVDINMVGKELICGDCNTPIDWQLYPDLLKINEEHLANIRARQKQEAAARKEQQEKRQKERMRTVAEQREQERIRNERIAKQKAEEAKRLAALREQHLREEERRYTATVADTTKPKSYQALLILGHIHVIIGYVGLGLNALLMLIAIALAVSDSTYNLAIAGALSLPFMIVSLLVFVTLLAAGELLFAIRDMAINSFVIRDRISQYYQHGRRQQ